MDRKQKNTVILGASLAAVVIAAAVLYSSLSGKYAPSGASVLSAASSQAESSASSAQREDLSEVSSQAISSASSAETSSAAASSGTASAAESSAAESSAAESSSGAAPSETPASSAAQSVSSGEPASSGQSAASKAPVSSAAQNASSEGALPRQAPSKAPASSSAAQSGEPENAAPDFTVYDASGKTVKLSDFRGKPVVLNFWASWCYYCKAELPDFVNVYNQNKDNVQFLFVNWTDGYRETQDRAENYLKQAGYSLPVYFDLDQDAVSKYNLTGIPATYFIGRDGSLVDGGEGMIDLITLESGIAKIAQ